MARVYTVKKRDADKPILVLIRDASDLARIVKNVPKSAERLMKAFWPGKLTIVFEAEAPHRIVGWIEAYPSLLDGVVRETVASRKETILDAYWKHNRREDNTLRRALQLEGR